MTENHVTYRGSMKDTYIIQLPAEWKGKVDLETISVSLSRTVCLEDRVG